MGENFTKHRGAGPAGELRWETCGLRWLAEAGGARVVEVLEVRDEELVERRLVPVTPTAAMAEAFGAALARTHLASAEAFGAPPPGWEGDGYLAGLHLPMPRLEQFGTFYASARVLPFARTAHRAGSLSDEGMRAVERVCERLMSGDLDDQQPPSRIHGDLWAGNVVFPRQGAVLVDAAAHGGHAETDLAMLDLFGAPHLERIQAAWQEACSPADGWRERTALHQLHPLLVHAVLFGGSYGARAQRVAQHFA
ncbi:MAG: fructosamine kinase family protein [Luteococcus sp.]|uniref:fructosamine kinase family protein n=1 Tax=Luteococcus sp. TaxID=1969402 RepID=UPI00264942FF|nr:fructosamine kinase family protein [Luteococcus sp.]MDN5562534.1 fructosamine kinase family protein [Luteococcus sp.]